MDLIQNEVFFEIVILYLYIKYINIFLGVKNEVNGYRVVFYVKQSFIEGFDFFNLKKLFLFFLVCFVFVLFLEE